MNNSIEMEIYNVRAKYYLNGYSDAHIENIKHQIIMEAAENIINKNAEDVEDMKYTNEELSNYICDIIDRMYLLERKIYNTNWCLIGVTSLLVMVSLIVML